MTGRTVLPIEAKIAIVHGLACFDPISAVVASIKSEFGIVVTPQAVEAHDPTKQAGKRLGARWRALFDETRAKFIDDVAAIPIAHRATRLRMLNRMAMKAENMGNLAMASKLLEQAAKEMGNAFTNKVDLQSTDGSMSPPPTLADFYGGIAAATIGGMIEGTLAPARTLPGSPYQTKGAG